MAEAAYRRVVLKLSGEVLATPGERGISYQSVDQISSELNHALGLGVQLGVVIGAGNIVRGVELVSDFGIEKVSADHIGILATLINALALGRILESRGTLARVMSAVDCAGLAEAYTRERALEHLESGRVVLFGGGTGNPCFTTDTAAVLRGVEIGAELILKGTKVDGIYPTDPVNSPQSTKYSELSYETILEKKLRIMDLTAVSLCMDNRLPILVFNITRPGELKRALLGEEVGTIVR